MERLIAWYRVGSSQWAVVALLLANAVPLVGVLLLDWNVWTILTIYWLENGVVGVFNVLKMAKAGGPNGGGKSMIPFFVMHYGIFWTVHGIFVLTLPEMQPFTGESDAGIRSDPLAVLIVIIGLFISHAVSYRYNYIGRGEYLRTTPARQMGAPYGRLVVLHVTIIFGALAIAFTGASAAAILILVILKTLLDLGLHLAEHRDAEGGAATSVGRREASG